MENSLSIKQALKVFAKISQYGQKREEEYFLNGLWAASSFDGYTVILRDELVTLYIYFHNTHKIEFSKKPHLEAFMKKLEDIDKMQLAK